MSLYARRAPESSNSFFFSLIGLLLVFLFLSNLMVFIAETSKIITDVIDEHDKIEDELKTAKQLTRNLRMREFADRILLGLAVLLYVSVCVYIILARLKLPLSGIFSFLFSSSSSHLHHHQGPSPSPNPLPPQDPKQEF